MMPAVPVSIWRTVCAQQRFMQPSNVSDCAGFKQLISSNSYSQLLRNTRQAAAGAADVPVLKLSICPATPSCKCNAKSKVTLHERAHYAALV